MVGRIRHYTNYGGLEQSGQVIEYWVQLKRRQDGRAFLHL